MKKKLVGYVLFFGICLVFCLVYRFPSQKVREWVNTQLESPAGYSMDIPGIFPAFPCGFQAEELILSHRGTPLLRFNLPRIQFNPIRLFDTNWQPRYQAKLLGGQVSGTLCLKNRRLDEIEFHLQLHQVAPHRFDLGPGWFNGSLSTHVTGTLGGHVQQESSPSFKGNFSCAPFQIDLPAPLFGTQQFTFTSGSFQFQSGKNQTIEIITCEFKGSQMDVELSGRFTPGHRAIDWTLDLRAAVTLHPLFLMDAGKGMPLDIKKFQHQGTPLQLIIQGSLAHPAISLGKETI